MKKIVAKIFALVLVLCLTASVAVVSASAASSKTVDLITDTKDESLAYSIAEKQGSNKFSVRNAADLAVGEVAYNGPSTTVYYASIGNAVKKDGMAVDFGESIDVSDYTDGKESKYKVDMWLWIEDKDNMDKMIFRFFEENTYKSLVESEKAKNCGEYRLCNKEISTFVTGWNHLVFTLPEFGLTSNKFEQEAYTNFRKNKTIRAMTVFGFGEKTSDYAIASLRITTDSQLATDYPEEFASSEGDANNLSADGESSGEEKELLDKIAGTQIKKYVTVISKGLMVDLSSYTAEAQQKVVDACTAEGLETVMDNGKLYLKGSELAKNAGVGGSGFPMWIIFVIIGVVVVAAVVVVVIVVAGKKKKAAAAVSDVKTENTSEDNEDEDNAEEEE